MAHADELAELYRLLASGAAKEIRQRNGLSQSVIADDVGSTAAAVSRWEGGHRRPRGRQALRYARLLRRLCAREEAAALILVLVVLLVWLVSSVATVTRGPYFTLKEAGQRWPALGSRLLRRLTERGELAYSRAGNRIVVTEADVEEYLESRRVEPVRDNAARRATGGVASSVTPLERRAERTRAG
jgi:predicted transcriptional regulator